MKTLTVTAENMPWIDRFCRNGLIDTLQKLHTGSLEIVEGDRLIDVAVTHGDSEIMLFTSAGKAIRFKEEDVRPMGRTARGVRGIKMPDDHEVNALIICSTGDILTATENGFGKRTAADDYPLQGRAGQGVVSIQCSARNGKSIGAI